MNWQSVAIVALIWAIFGLALFSYWKIQSVRAALIEREKAVSRRMYELAILKELGERIGYSLNIQKIIDIITGSLRQFIEYSAVSYMLLSPERILFKAHLEKSVSRSFLDDIQDRMLKSLSVLLSKELPKKSVEETLTGAILVEDVAEPVRSFFNIPLVIGGKVVGVMTVAHTQAGLYKEEEMTILYKIVRQASDAVTRLQEVVETEQRKLNAMVESMAEGVVMTDKDYRVVVVNPAARRAAGILKKTEVTIFDFIDALGGKFDIRGKLEESVKLDKVLVAPEALLGERFFQVIVSPVKSTFGLTADEILGGVVIFHDITQEKEVERLREDFTSMMVHELRSPLDGIKKMADTMRTDAAVRRRKKTYDEYLGLIFEGSSRMLELVEDLLDVAKLEAGKFEIRRQASDLKQIAEERVRFFAASARDARIRLGVVCDARLPQQASFDPWRVTQVLNNLISNSIKFTAAGGTVTVQAFLHQRGTAVVQEAKTAGIDWRVSDTEALPADAPDALVVAVTDTGVGIFREHLPHLFNKFKQFRATAVSGEHKGTGLGLAIAKGIVEAHGGTIGVASAVGIGSTFYFTLPLDVPAGAPVAGGQN